MTEQEENMAKRKASRGDFNMSAEIRTLLQENGSLTSSQIFEELKKRFPDQSINRNSCNVAFSQARRKLGIRPGAKRSVRRRRPGAAKSVVHHESVNLPLLKSARKFLEEAGNAQAAMNAIQQVEALQIK